MFSTNGFELFAKCDKMSEDISKELVSLNCCQWCILRILGEKNYSLYCRKSITKLNNLFGLCSSTSGTESDSVVCPVCLGILQKLIKPEFLNEISLKVSEEGYEYEDYQCSLFVPVCTIVRQHSIFLHLQEKFSSLYSKIPEDEIPHIKDVWKWICGPDLSSELKSEFKSKSCFEISVIFDYEDSDKECNFLLATNPNEFQRRKKVELFNRTAVQKSVSSLPDDLFRKYYQCPCSVPLKQIKYSISCNYEAIYVAGRYNKYSRTLSQTPWFIQGERKTQSSVEEEICNCFTSFQATEFRFSASGREDVDVRMLGNGRPFIVEIINAHKYSAVEELQEIQKTINRTSTVVQVRDLQLINRNDTLKLKEGELEKSKCYLALCWSEKPLTEDQIEIINSQKDLEVLQKTPIRVLHRRSQATRTKIIYSMKVEAVKENYFKLSLSTQAGTYIKEFVHGDFGRTLPNICTIVRMNCDILTLDVANVALNWPPQLESG